MKTKTKLLTAGGTVLLALLLGTCNNAFHDLIPPEDNIILSFVLDGQLGSQITERGADKGNVTVKMRFDRESYELVPRISVPPKASVLPLTAEYLQAAFPHLRELPEEELLDEISRFINAPDTDSYILGLLERSPGSNIPALDMPIDFFDDDGVEILVIAGNGLTRIYTCKLQFDFYTGSGGVPMERKNHGTFTMGNDYLSMSYWGENAAGKMVQAENSSQLADIDGVWVLGLSAPAHEVTLTKDFFISKDMVTNAQFAAVMGYLPNSYGSPPASTAYMTWYQAAAYCNKLSEVEGYEPYYNISGTTVTRNTSANGYRLPTEAEFYYSFVPANWATFKTEAAELGRYNTDYFRQRADDLSDPNPDYLEEFKHYTQSFLGGRERYEMESWCWDWYAPYDGFYDTLSTQEIQRPLPVIDPEGASESESTYFKSAWSLPAVHLIATFQLYYHNPIVVGNFVLVDMGYGYMRIGWNWINTDRRGLVIARNAD